MQLLSADATVFLEKKFTNLFWPWKHEKTTLKSCSFSLDPFFMYRPGCPNSPKTEIRYHQKPLNTGLSIQTGGQTQLAISI